MLTTQVLERWEEVASWSAFWDRLLAESASDTAFLTWDWIDSWWKAYGRGSTPLVVLIRRGDDLIGIAPLRIRPVSRYRVLRHEAIQFIGDGSADSDYLDLIARKGEEQAVCSEVVQVLRERSGERRAFAYLNEIPSGSPHVAGLRDTLAAAGWLCRMREVPCADVALPGTWEDYLRLLRPRMRTKIRSLDRRLQGRRVAFEYCRSEADLAEHLEALFRLHQQRWAGHGGGVFDSAPKRAFYGDMARRFLERDWLRLAYLEVDGTRVAYQLCFEYRGTMFLLQEGYDPEWMEHGVGNALRAWMFRDCIERGVARYDFLGGVTEHKRAWGATPKSSVRLFAAPSSVAPRLYVDLPDFTDRAAGWIRTRVAGRRR